MKHLKAKLMGAVVMLLISALMLSTASYAWFTISTAPEISGIDTGMAANGNLEIALASDANFTTEPGTVGPDTTTTNGKNTYWGNMVDLSGMNDKITLKPIQFNSSDGSAKAPKFGTDGRINGLTDLTATWMSMTALEATGDGGVTVFEDNQHNAYAYRVDFFMRTNTPGDISLTTTGLDRGAGTTGGGTTITADTTKGIKVFIKANDGTVTKVYDGSATNPTWSTDALLTITESTINQIQKVSMFVVWDGADLDNAAFTNAVQDVKLNVQFQHSATLDALDVTGSDN